MKKIISAPWFGIGFFGLFMVVASPEKILATDIAIIVNSANDIQTISDGQLKNLFLKIDRYWSDNVPVTAVHRNEGSPAYDLFLSRVQGQSSSQALSFWIDRKQTDGSSPPLQVSEDRLVIHLVASVKGAIGYVEANHVADHPQGIRVIRIIKE